MGPAVYAGRKIHIPAGKEMDLMYKVKAGPQRKIVDTYMEENVEEHPPVGEIGASERWSGGTCNNGGCQPDSCT